MNIVKSHDKFPWVPGTMSEGTCLDRCGGKVWAGQVQVNDRTEFVAVHSGKMCSGFKGRFGESEDPSRAEATMGLDEAGNFSREPAKRRRHAPRLEDGDDTVDSKPALKSDDKSPAKTDGKPSK